jgi:hypothetical protein
LENFFNHFSSKIHKFFLANTCGIEDKTWGKRERWGEREATGKDKSEESRKSMYYKGFDSTNTKVAKPNAYLPGFTEPS